MILLTDYEIASQTKLKKVNDLLKEYNIKEDLIENYGPYKAKIDYTKIDKKKKGKLILVTSCSPTPSGEGKTTLAIGINDALRILKKNSIVALREPSLGPVFGLKGGACGGGYAQVAPMDDINLHFTGDIHAVTACNNLLSAIIDNHLYWGNELNLDENTIAFKRCLDVNDRALRKVKLTNRNDGFNISTASEIMAILCLSTDMEDLKRRLGNIFIGYTKDHKCVFAKDLKCVGALAILLKDALKPNAVQTLENNLAFVHGGPFANIAHGTNSIISTNLALSLSDYVLVEAGFGSDMGGFKFFDLITRNFDIVPSVVVVNVTIKGLKYNGEDNLEKGLANLDYHVTNMQKFSDNVLVVLNKFTSDTQEEIDILANHVQKLKASFAISEAFSQGGKGAITVAQEVINLSEKKPKKITYPYELSDSLYDKVHKVCCNYLNARDVLIKDEIKDKFDRISQDFADLPICIAKTQYSISDDKNLLGNPKDFTVTVSDVEVASGAGFIVVSLGSIMRMPGLSRNSNYLNMDIEDNVITGLF